MHSAIIAGGDARRLGGAPKGLLEVQGRRILDRIVDACQSAFGRAPMLVANSPAAHQWVPGLTVVADHTAGHGPLGGIETAIRVAGEPVVCLAWDMPFLTPELLRTVAAPLDRFDVAIPESSPDQFEPLCAGYGPGALPAIEAALARGDRRVTGWLSQVRVCRIQADTLASLGDVARLFLNVNTPDDLARANGAMPR
ncbi:MAG: molybdenum cofactor guanylyltransferase [Gemmatimonadales bacterium]